MIVIFLVNVVVKASMFYLVNLIITVNSTPTYKSKDVRVIPPKILNFCSSFVPVCPHVMMDFLKLNMG